MLRMPGPGAENGREPSPYVELERAAWAALSQATESPLSPEEISRLRGLGDALDLDEVEQVYLPLSRLLSMYVGSAGALHREQEAFLHRPQPPRIKDVAAFLAMDRTTLTANLKPLERRNLVEVVVDPKDRRGRRLKLTAAGRDVRQ